MAKDIVGLTYEPIVDPEETMTIMISKTGDEILVEGDSPDVGSTVSILHDAYLMMVHELFCSWAPAIHYLDTTKRGSA